MENTNKATIHILENQGWSIFVFISYPPLFKNVTDLQKILKIEKNFVLTKKSKC